MQVADDRDLSLRVLVLMPSVRDAELTAALLTEARVETLVCGDITTLSRELLRGAGALLVTDEPILLDRSGQLADALHRQPAWSSVPLVVIVREGASELVQKAVPESLTTLTLVERPVRMRSFSSVVLSALRSRRHQYEIRDAIVARETEEQKLRFALDAGRLGSWSLDLQTHAIDTSDLLRQIFGRAPEEPFTFEDVKAAIHPEDRPEVVAIFDDGIAYTSEHRIVLPDGTQRWVDICLW